MERRRYIHALAGAVTFGLAGCSAPSEQGSPTGTTDGAAAGGETETAQQTPTGTSTESPTEAPAETANETTAGTNETTAGTNETTAGANETTTNGTANGTTNGTATGTGGSAQVTSYRLGGQTSAWLGREPQTIAEQENPTLNLEAGTQYEITWENLDGVPHNLAIQDSQGNTLASTETMSEEGATLTLTFTASEEMAQYICTIHPTTMVGDITFSG